MGTLTSHYIYSHSVNGDIFYIGSGNSKRPHDKRCRTKLWKDKTSTINAFDINILFEFDNKEDAHDIEKELIYKIKPECNIYHTKVSPSETEIRQVTISKKAVDMLDTISACRRAGGLPVKFKNDIIQYLVEKELKRELRSLKSSQKRRLIALSE